jgi:localization factor PodJL
MSLGQWLNTKVAQPAPAQRAYAPQQPQPPYAPPPQPAYAPQPGTMPGAAADSLAEIHQRLDGITRQIDQMSQRRAGLSGAPTASGLANQLNDAISRLDMRLNNLTQSAQHARSHAPAYPPHSHHPAERSTAEMRQGSGYHVSPPLSPMGMDAAIAEISARRNSLNGGAASMPAPNPFMQYAPAPPLAPAPAPVDLSGIERQLHNLTSQMEALRRPDHLEQSIATFREELAEIRRSLTEALPRQAIDSLENEIRALGQKIERSRESGGDQETLGGIERALNEIYNAVRTLTPAEQLAGYDTAIQNLSSKIDLLVRANPDSNIVQQLEAAIAALRNIAANVASNDAIVHLGDHIRALGEKLDHLSQSGGHDMLAALEQRIAVLTAAMEARPVQPAAESSHLESAIRALSERIDRLSVGHDSSGAMAHVEQRIAYLLERLEGAQPQGLGRIEQALSDVLRHLEHQRLNFAPAGGAQTDTAGIVDTIRRELSDVRHSQSATDRRTQDALEALHSTLGHVVDRLTVIEGDLRRVQATAEPQPLAQAAPHAPPPAIRPELANPVLPQMSDVRIPVAAAAATRADEVPPAPAWQQTAQRVPIDPNLPPDFPLEPGARNRAPEAGTASGLGHDAAPAGEGSGQSNFIAAARRAAQAAAAATSEKPGRVTALTEAARSAAAKATAKVAAAGDTPAKSSRIRSILVGLGVVVLVAGAFKIALTFLDTMESMPAQTTEKSSAPAALTPPPAPAPVSSPKAEAPVPNPLLTSPTAVERHSFVAPANAAPQPAAETPAPVPGNAGEVTGSVTLPAASSAPVPAPATDAGLAALSPVSDKLPDAVAGPQLRAAALRGEGAAAYEIGARYAEGRGTAVNYEEAIKWYERAADKGIVLAMFRLGTLLEKGLGTTKNPDAARRYYLQAAERGNAKAMHNLAVLDADGGGKGPNYKAAANWFKKAAERGIADSQYNLGILYARGIGLEQNLAESFKWFSLAAAQGDADAGRKRDDIAKRLDQQSLAAAKLAIQTFTPERQPSDAISVAAPAGGWDAASTAPATRRPAKSQGKTASR